MTIEEACFILNVSPTATMAEIKQARNERAKLFHPDLITNEEMYGVAHTEMARINQAYDYMKKTCYAHLHYEGPYVHENSEEARLRKEARERQHRNESARWRRRAEAEQARTREERRDSQQSQDYMTADSVIQDIKQDDDRVWDLSSSRWRVTALGLICLFAPLMGIALLLYLWVYEKFSIMKIKRRYKKLGKPVMIEGAWNRHLLSWILILVIYTYMLNGVEPWLRR